MMTNSSAFPLSIVIPAYNEEDRLVSALDRLVSWHSARFDPVEIIVVDDGSTDRTREVVRRYLPRDPRLHLVEAAHGGNMHALITGYKKAQFDYVGNLEADLAADPNEFERLARHLEKADIVTGSRQLRGDRSEEHTSELQSRVDIS